ncbi:COG1361 family protein [Actinoplanes sp. RD1]|uniref:hypothetical protein n=1 Tax=Actinoplanes sp. RD1 TaxID=3064538 RepID=UPI002740C8D1|nr:hypothetical protein [Actinoplanes sp. RD1]
MRLAEDEVRRALRALAAAHVPDREAMLDRFTRTALRDEPVLRRSSARMRAAGAAVAVTALLGGGGLAQWSFAGNQETDLEPVLPPVVTTPATPEPSQTRPLWTDGSVVKGSSVITVKTSARLDALVVTVRLRRTAGLTARSGSHRVPGASVTTTVTERDDALVYRFVMSPADSVPPGTYTFSARYRTAAGGRDATGDTYEVQVTTSGGTDLEVSDDFE